MKFCPECGNKLNGEKFCPECGFNLNENMSKEEHNHNGMKCPYCGSSNISTQILTINQSRGCLSIFLYLILACFTFGLALIFLLAKGNKSRQETCYICQNCGRRLNKYQIFGSSAKPIKLTKKQQNAIAIWTLVICAIIALVSYVYLVDYQDKVALENKIAIHEEASVKDIQKEYVKSKDDTLKKYENKYIYETIDIYNVSNILESKEYTTTYVLDNKNNSHLYTKYEFEDTSSLSKFVEDDNIKNINIYCKFDSINKNENNYNVILKECFVNK